MNPKLQKFFNRFKLPSGLISVENLPLTDDQKQFISDRIRDDVYVTKLCLKHSLYVFFTLTCFFTILSIVQHPEVLKASFPNATHEPGYFLKYIWPFVVIKQISPFLIAGLALVYALYFLFYRKRNFTRKDLYPDFQFSTLKKIGFHILRIFLLVSFYYIAYFLGIWFSALPYSIFGLPLIIFMNTSAYAWCSVLLHQILVRLLPLSSAFRLYTEEK